MNKYLLILGLFIFIQTYAQSDDEAAVKKTIETFFEAFHAQDSAALHSLAGESIIMQTIAQDKEGNPVVKSNPFEEFVRTITSIPDTVNFSEKLKGFEIKIDGPMANAWTPYEFWVNDQFSHCGVNSFQLLHNGENWKIIYIIDTRRREGCNQE